MDDMFWHAFLMIGMPARNKYGAVIEFRSSQSNAEDIHSASTVDPLSNPGLFVVGPQNFSEIANSSQSQTSVEQKSKLHLKRYFTRVQTFHFSKEQNIDEA